MSLINVAVIKVQYILIEDTSLVDLFTVNQFDFQFIFVYRECVWLPPRHTLSPGKHNRAQVYGKMHQIC